MSLFLQIQDLYNQSLSARLTDQLFSVVLLVGFAIYSLRRQNAIEEKLEKYMEEDREELKEVIANNTKAFEMFNNKVIKLSAVLVLLLFTSCKHIRKTHETLVKDSLVTHAQTTITSNYTRDRVREIKDSGIVIPSRKASTVLGVDEQKPLYTDKGVPKSNKTRTKQNGIEINTSANPDGTLSIDASSDSMLLIIKGITRERDSIDQALNLLKNNSNTISHVQATNTKTSQKGWSFTAILFAFSAGIASTWLIGKFQLINKLKLLIG